MRKKFLSSCMIAFLGISLASCSSDNTVAENAESAVNHYSPEGTSYISVSPAQEATSRSALADDENYLNFQWKAGDQLIVVEPTAGVIGTLTTTSGSDMSTSGGNVSATFSGTVKGTLADGDKLRYYYLGNKSVETGTKTLDCDFSLQAGTLTSAASLRYLATGEVTMKKNTETGNFEPSSSLALASKISILKFKLTYNDGTSTYNASDCTINGLYNKASIDLCNGAFTSDYVKNVYDQSEYVKSIVMSHSRSESSPYYYVAVPVFESKTFENPNMRCTFFDANSTTLMQSWTSWTIGQGSWYAGTDGTGMALELDNNYTTKGGYGGCDILGGTNNTDYSTKDGYNGQNADGSIDDPEVTKGGYTGTDVH